MLLQDAMKHGFDSCKVKSPQHVGLFITISCPIRKKLEGKKAKILKYDPKHGKIGKIIEKKKNYEINDKNAQAQRICEKATN